MASYGPNERCPKICTDTCGVGFGDMFAGRGGWGYDVGTPPGSMVDVGGFAELTRNDLMRIGIISDTHDSGRYVRRALEVFAEQKVECILHAGDITGCSTASTLAMAPGSRMIAVFGNCDTERLSLRSAIETSGGEIHDRVFDGQVDGKTVCMMHIPRGINHAAASGKYDLIVFGHTHRQDIQRSSTTLVVNPGAGQTVIVDTADMSATPQSLA